MPRTKAVSRQRGFTLTELVVVGGLLAVVFTTAAMAYRTMALNQGRSINFQAVTLGRGITNAFYPPEDPAFPRPSSVDVMSAPHYGTTLNVGVMREQMNDDTAKSCAVYALPRGPIAVDPASSATAYVANVNWVHPPYDTSVSPAKPPVIRLSIPGNLLDTPASPQSDARPSHDTFFELLSSEFPGTASKPFPFIHTATSADAGFTAGSAIVGYYRGVPAPLFVNGSIYFLQAGGPIGEVLVRSVWDIDLIKTTSPAGVYASVKRYQGTTLTHYYDTFYEGEDQVPGDFGPLFALFERKVRKAKSEPGKPDAFKAAENRPFYLMWWPDPSMRRLAGNPGPALTAADPRNYYMKHEQQTSLMFVVPLFPQL
jgi:hypothetical protein